MTVNELIAKLQALPPDVREMTAHFDGEPGCSPSPITDVYVARWRHVVTGEVHTRGVAVGDDMSGHEDGGEPEVITIENGLR